MFRFFPEYFEPAMSDYLRRCASLSGSYPHTYFAGANTPDGFVSAYPAWIREKELERVFVIKGGSGTGKSSMMKACATEAARLGASITLLLCSSDPASADAVILRGKNGRGIAILDGTAPHMTDPELPGAASEIINAGLYWNTPLLQAQKSEIALRNEAKKNAYARVYRFLSAYRSVSESVQALLKECLLFDKMEDAASRISSRLPRGGTYSETLRYTHAISMTGIYRLTTFSCSAEKEFRIMDAHGTGHFFLQALRTQLQRMNAAILFSPLPVCPHQLGEIYLPECRTNFTLTNHRDNPEGNDIRFINMQRFIDSEKLAARRIRLRFAEKCRAMLLDGAQESLAEAREHHFALEEIYKNAMDFSGIQGETDALSRRIAGMLQE